MSRSRLFSDKNQIRLMARILENYLRLPFTEETIPGAIMEHVLAHVRGAEVLNTYDFVDVVQKRSHVAWQVKSTKASTPVTWKRAKIPNADELVAKSRKSDRGIQRLGDAVIAFCNAHAKESIELYDLEEIGYARLIVHDDGNVTYFERAICTRDSPDIFSADEFQWRWSKPKRTQKKEQLPALHGIKRNTGEKWFAWHGLGENQLHFSGEGNWWPVRFKISFQRPTGTAKLSLSDFLELTKRIDD
jgi:hypothetical protein